MDIKKLAPWNWFKQEEDAGKKMQVQHTGPQGQHHPLYHQIHQEFDRLFDNMVRGFWMPQTSLLESDFSQLGHGILKPTLDIGSTEKEYAVTVEVPGVDEKDIKLELSDNTLTIRGEKKREQEEKEKDYYRLERSYGSFQRILSLPDDADQDNIQAGFKKGVLTITIPRKALPKPDVKRIEVKKAT
ncbi:MAG: Hsp20/alpha crystallin family protein [Desulfobacterales bacterium]|nr:Hsp20/alpha crystallin family protein [Desulfobacterales bacterium]